MAKLTIRNLSDDQHAALNVRAEREILDAAVLRSRATGFMSAEEIDAAKQVGRK